MKTYQLAMHSVLRLDDGRSTLITCTRGMVWMTEAGQDIVLRCGQSHLIRSDDRVVIEPLVHSSVAVQGPGTRLMSRLGGALRDLAGRVARRARGRLTAWS